MRLHSVIGVTGAFKLARGWATPRCHVEQMCRQSCTLKMGQITGGAMREPPAAWGQHGRTVSNRRKGGGSKHTRRQRQSLTFRYKHSAEYVLRAEGWWISWLGEEGELQTSRGKSYWVWGEESETHGGSPLDFGPNRAKSDDSFVLWGHRTPHFII